MNAQTVHINVLSFPGCENKEISKFTAALANCTQIFRDSFQEFMKVCAYILRIIHIYYNKVFSPSFKGKIN